jgi:hypothetical protein
MQEPDRKAAWAFIFMLAIIAAEVAWFLFIGAAHNVPSYSAHCEKECEVPWWDSAVAWTCIFTGFLTFSTLALWKETRRLAKGGEENSRHQLRAYLSLTRMRFIPEKGMARFRLMNTGQTPAKNINVRMAMQFCNYPEIIALTDKNRIDQVFFCGGGRYVRFRCPPPLGFTKEDWAEHNRHHERALFFTCRVDFMDIFNRPHWITARGRIGTVEKNGAAPIYPSAEGNDGS